MEVSEQQVTDLVYGVIDGINSQSSKKKKIEKEAGFQLYGDGGNLDSMDLVGLIVDVEQKISKSFGVNVALANEKSLSQTNSPFRSVGSLIEFVVALLGDD
jgi:acyl carrier protein